MKYQLTNQTGWLSYKRYEVYDTNDDPNLERHVLDYPEDWERVEDDFVLPEKWYLKITRENKDIATQWRDAMCSPTYKSCLLVEGWYILSKHLGDESYYFSSSDLPEREQYHDYKEITTEQFIKYVYNPKFNSNMPTQKLTVPISDVLRIHAMACSLWKTKIATEYLPRVDVLLKITFTQEEVDEMFDAATSTQLSVLEEIFGKRSEPIQWDKIKTGSKVMIKHTRAHCSGFNSIDANEPVDVVFFKTPYLIDGHGVFNRAGAHLSYCTFHQNGKYVLFSSDKNVSYITRVIEY